MTKKISSVVLVVLFLFIFMPGISDGQSDVSNVQIATGSRHSLGLNSSGRVYSAGDNTYGQTQTWHWKDIEKVAAGVDFSAGLKSDKTVIVAGNTQHHGIDVSSWEGIMDIFAGERFLAGIKDDGRVVVSGGINLSTEDRRKLREDDEWGDIIALSGGNHLVGLRSNGECVVAADSQGYHSKVEKVWKGISKISSRGNTIIALKSDGTLLSSGTVYKIANGEDYFWTPDIENWNDIVDVSAAVSNGEVYVVAMNSEGMFFTDYPSDDEAYPAFNIVSSGEILSFKMGLGSGEELHHLILESDGKVFSKGVKSGLGYEYIDNAKWNLLRETLYASPSAQDKIAAGSKSMAIIREDASFKTLGIELSGFEDVAKVSAATSISSGQENRYAGITGDERVVTNFSDGRGGSWRGIQKVSISRDSVAGVRWDGTAFSTRTLEGSPVMTGVKSVATGPWYTALLYEDKTVAASTYGKPTAVTFSVDGWTNIKEIYAGDRHLIGVKEDGSVVATGDTSNNRCAVDGWSIVSAAAGRNHTVGLRADGTCVTTYAQNSEAWEEVSRWRDITAVYAGDGYTLGVTAGGQVLFAGGSNTLEVKKPAIQAEVTREGTTLEILMNINMKNTLNDIFGKVYIGLTDDEGTLHKLIIMSETAYAFSDNEIDVLRIENSPAQATHWKILFWDDKIQPISSLEGQIK